MTPARAAKNLTPSTIDEWFDEIAKAYNEALATIPFAPLAGAVISPADLFHLAPAIALKLRSLKMSPRLLKKATDAALSTYVANLNENDKLPGGSILAFSLCYLASHYGLGLVTEESVSAVMDAVVSDGASLARRIEEGELLGMKVK